MMAGGAAAWVMSLFNSDIILVVAAAAAVLMLITLVSAGVIFDYEGTDTIGRTFVAGIGIVVVGGGMWYIFVRDDTPPV